ncbi:GAF domain-containing protein, partial [Methylomicrobium sp. Wu6]|uniref:GAF domain-containing protein n=1 Tax=Methylomicrobium sp. Wu6 TaxID=3107928 RepID=UPI002DD6B36C
FFNKTRTNILANPYATLTVTDSQTAAIYRLHIRYLHTETSGPLFETMRAKLAGIAAHTGMSNVFRLLGADLYRVLDIERVPGTSLPAAEQRPNWLSLLRKCLAATSACEDMDGLVDAVLHALEDSFGIGHAIVLMHDPAHNSLYTVASLGYETAGIGSEIPLGHGVIGIAGQMRIPIRISHMVNEYGYGKAVRASMQQIGLTTLLETAIPMPGIAECRSQMAVPIKAKERLLGVLYVESDRDCRFGYDEEDAMAIFANHLAQVVSSLAADGDIVGGRLNAAAPIADKAGTPIRVRHFARDHSVFIDNAYLIKGVAGAIFWHLLQNHQTAGRQQFSNRELRLQAELGLPDLADNLETRLVLLKRRLEERQCGISLQKAGRGVFNLQVEHALILEETA